MPGLESFFLSWWYTPNTRLGLFFNDFAIDAGNQVLTIEDNSGGNTWGLDASNGLGASVEEDYHFESLISRHPIEDGSIINDHIVNLPRTITITALMTAITPTVLVGHIDFNQLGNATKILIDLWEQNTGISVLTGLLYGRRFLRVDNMAIRSLDIPRTNQYGRSSIKFTIVLEQLIITSQEGDVTTAGYSNANALDDSTANSILII